MPAVDLRDCCVWKNGSFFHNKLLVFCVHRYVRANLHKLLRLVLLQSMDFVNRGAGVNR